MAVVFRDVESLCKVEPVNASSHHLIKNSLSVNEGGLQAEELVDCNKQAQFQPVDGKGDNASFVALLRDCAKQKDLSKGTRVHADICRCGPVPSDLYVGTALVNMYAKCGELAKAQEVFDELTIRNVVSWNALISGYACQGCVDKAVICFHRMLDEGFFPNVVTFLCILKACGNAEASKIGEEFHAEVCKQGFLKDDMVLGTALIDMYARCGTLEKAQKIFDELPYRDVVTWSVLISGYVQHGHGNEALNCFERMQDEGILPDIVTFLGVLKACSTVRAIDKGKGVHIQVVRHGLLQKNVTVGTALVDLYASCGELVKAREVFDLLPFHDVVAWSAIIGGYAQSGYGHEALKCYEAMQSEGVSPDIVTFTCILKACGIIGASEKGEEIHDEVARQGLLGKTIVLDTALLDMYAKCGKLTKAQEVFDELPERNVVTWNALIAGYMQEGFVDEAFYCFHRMQDEGFLPDMITFTCILKACGSIGAAENGKEVHAAVIQRGLLDKEIILGNALVDMYAKCSMLSKAQEAFEKLPIRDALSWNILISSYAEHGHGFEALWCFEAMLEKGFLPNSITFISILQASGSLGAAEKGKEIHADVLKQNLITTDITLGTAVVDMYAKCDILMKAQEVFDFLSTRDVICWNAIIAGYVQHGYRQEAVNLFEQMQYEGLLPNAVTFLILLNVCSHSGLLVEGQIWLVIMNMFYGILPYLHHYACMVDLFGRAGHLGKVLAVIKGLPHSDSYQLWSSVLGACHKWRDVELGRLAFNYVQLNDDYAAAHVSMRNIYLATPIPEH